MACCSIYGNSKHGLKERRVADDDPIPPNPDNEAATKADIKQIELKIDECTRIVIALGKKAHLSAGDLLKALATVMSES